ncbi:MAG: hypothetical protein E7605_02185 [Ruminococcaceae bacterium]|nr:hypothetical protein [Oscillospiraceae bacterium]
MTLTLCLRHAFAVPVFDVHSLPRGKERTKKTRQDVPSWISLALPLFKEDRGEKHNSLFCISRQFATTSGRYAKAKSFAGF